MDILAEHTVFWQGDCLRPVMFRFLNISGSIPPRESQSELAIVYTIIYIIPVYPETVAAGSIL